MKKKFEFFSHIFNLYWHNDVCQSVIDFLFLLLLAAIHWSRWWKFFIYYWTVIAAWKGSRLENIWSNNFPLIASYRLHKLNVGSEIKLRGVTSKKRVRNWKWSSRCDFFNSNQFSLQFFFFVAFFYHPRYAPCYYVCFILKNNFSIFFSPSTRAKKFNLRKMIPLRVENVYKHSVS